jgi:glycosyltransferase involved in cell wall biosynthesis
MTIHDKGERLINQRILYVHYGDNWLRGSEIVLLDLLKSAKENHYSPVLWCNSSVLEKKALSLGIEVIVDDFVCIGYWTTPKWNFLQFFKLLRKAKKLLTEYNISLVHCNNGAPCQWMVPICKLSGIPLLLHLHARYLYRDRLTLLFHYADRIVGVSQSVTAIFKPNEFTPQQICTIYNGIDPSRVITPFPRDIRAELSAKESDFVILYIGSLIPRKSVDKLLYALDKLTPHYNLKLAIVGSGGEKEKLSSLTTELNLNNNVSFFSDNDNVAAMYSSNADCFISVPTEEVFGLTLAEASMAKLPIITSNIPGINEIYTDKINALLVTPSNTHELVTAITSLIEKPSLQKKLSINAQKHIMHKFSLRQQFNAFNKTYQSLSKTKMKQSMVKVFFKNTFKHSKLILRALFKKCQKRLLLPSIWGKNYD